MKELIYLIVLILGVPVGWILENVFEEKSKTGENVFDGWL
jgi:hypothetical protein